VVLGRAPLLASLQRAAILTSERFKGVRVNLEPGLLRIASSNAEQEEAKEELEVDYNGDAIEIGFNVTYLIDVLSNAGGEMVKMELQDTNAATRIQVRGHADADLTGATGSRSFADYSRPVGRLRFFPRDS
jgi:DNA polymerase-3 subunit beta